MSDVAKTYTPPPKKLAGFPNAKPAKRKTPVKGGGGLRKRWLDGDDILEWDSQHGKIEKYNKKGKHKGEFDPKTGNETKPADPTRSITPSRFDKAGKKMPPIEYCLSWFSKVDEEFAGEEDIDLTPDDVRRWFNLKSDDPACNSYEVSEAQATDLRDRVSHAIDLDSFDYFVDGYDPDR